METDSSSTSTTSPIDPHGLRRMPESYQDLRHVAAQQVMPIPSKLMTPLLPSPISHGFFEQDESYFRFRHPRLARDDYKSYEDLHILSCYYDDAKTESMDDIERALDEDLVSEEAITSGDGDDDSLSSSDDMPHTPIPKSERKNSSAEEADWLANSRSPSERLRRFKARCYQVVQHPMNYKCKEHAESGIVSLVS